MVSYQVTGFMASQKINLLASHQKLLL